MKRLCPLHNVHAFAFEKFVTGGTHVAIANLSYLLLGLATQRFGWQMPIDGLHLGIVSLWGVLADLDSPSSWLGKQIPLLGLLLERRLGRRGWTHTFWAALIVSCPWFLVNASLAWAALVGYCVHLLIDAASWPGLKPWRPLHFRVGIVLFRNGSFWDLVIGMSAIVGSWLCLVQRVGSATARALEDPFAWGIVLILVALLPGWLLSTTIRRI
jgi:membrane-bound metal-dependent hydrolase YbcI (DUF457 family)